jgi:hypothetical protein
MMMTSDTAGAGRGGTAGRQAGRIVLSLFDTVAEAAQALEDLIEIGAPAAGISLVARQDAGPNRPLRRCPTASAASAPPARAAAARGPERQGDRNGRSRRSRTGRRGPRTRARVREEGAGVLWARLARLGITLDFLPLPGVGWAMAAGPLSEVLRSPEAGLGWGRRAPGGGVRPHRGRADGDARPPGGHGGGRPAVRRGRPSRGHPGARARRGADEGGRRAGGAALQQRAGLPREGVHPLRPEGFGSPGARPALLLATGGPSASRSRAAERNAESDGRGRMDRPAPGPTGPPRASSCAQETRTQARARTPGRRARRCADGSPPRGRSARAKSPLKRGGKGRLLMLPTPAVSARGGPGSPAGGSYKIDRIGGAPCTPR